MADTHQLSPGGRLLFWILGTALFFIIAILPYAMYMRFAADVTVRVTVIASATVVLMLLWLTTTFGPLKGRPPPRR